MARTLFKVLLEGKYGQKCLNFTFYGEIRWKIKKFEKVVQVVQSGTTQRQTVQFWDPPFETHENA